VRFVFSDIKKSCNGVISEEIFLSVLLMRTIGKVFCVFAHGAPGSFYLEKLWSAGNAAAYQLARFGVCRDSNQTYRAPNQHSICFTNFFHKLHPGKL
jgi:hypothetical protein